MSGRGSANDTKVPPTPFSPSRHRSGSGRDGFPVTDDPIDIDGRRTVTELWEIDIRRRTANGPSYPETSGQAHLESLEKQMLAEPIPTWIEALERFRLLLDRYSATPDGQAPRIQKLIERALGDIEQLRKQKERE